MDKFLVLGFIVGEFLGDSAFTYGRGDKTSRSCEVKGLKLAKLSNLEIISISLEDLIDKGSENLIGIDWDIIEYIAKKDRLIDIVDFRNGSFVFITPNKDIGLLAWNLEDKMILRNRHPIGYLVTYDIKIVYDYKDNCFDLDICNYSMTHLDDRYRIVEVDTDMTKADKIEILDLVSGFGIGCYENTYKFGDIYVVYNKVEIDNVIVPSECKIVILDWSFAVNNIVLPTNLKILHAYSDCDTYCFNKLYLSSKIDRLTISSRYEDGIVEGFDNILGALNEVAKEVIVY